MSDDRKWVCGICRAQFDSHQPLHDHIQKEHQSELGLFKTVEETYKQTGDPTHLTALQMRLGQKRAQERR